MFLKKTISKIKQSAKTNKGYCLICEKKVTFTKHADWLRDNYKCNSCFSIPRHRAIINSLNLFYPDWQNMAIHESSPGGVSSSFIKKKSKNYNASHFFKDVPLGQSLGEFRCEDLSDMTFEDNSFDLFITQDVFEHVLYPEKAFSEIARVLKPGGAHVFTMPWFPKLALSVPRVKEENGTIQYLKKPIYHGNPIDDQGSLVTIDWGLDLTEVIYQNGGLMTTVYLEKNPYLGLEADFLEVFICRKVN